MTEKQFYNLHHRPATNMWHHPYHSKKGFVFEHRLEVEQKIGRYLKPKEAVHHHYNKDGSATLVLCPDKTYHSLLHIREEALRYCGHANWRKCTYCKQYDDLKNLIISEFQIHHKMCSHYYNNVRNRLKVI